MEFLEFRKNRIFWATKCSFEKVNDKTSAALPTKTNCLFVRVGKNDFREVCDLNSANCIWFPKFMILREDMPHYAPDSKRPGIGLITNLEPAYVKPEEQQDKVDIVELLMKSTERRSSTPAACQEKERVL